MSVTRKRQSWSEYFFDLCSMVSARSTCDRKHVGAVIVRDKRILATGYNGSVPGAQHCDEAGHDLVKLADGTENCVRTVHAEANAILQAAKLGVSTDNADLYVNTYPCWHCAKMILSCGIARVFVDGDYRNDPRVEAAFSTSSVQVLRRR